MSELLTAARLVLGASGDDLVDALAWLDDAVQEEDDVATGEGGEKFTVTIWLDSEDLDCIAERYEREHGEPPRRSSRAFRVYCKDMIGYAVGAAGAGKWEEGVV